MTTRYRVRDSVDSVFGGEVGDAVECSDKFTDCAWDVHLRLGYIYGSDYDVFGFKYDEVELID